MSYATGSDFMSIVNRYVNGAVEYYRQPNANLEFTEEYRIRMIAHLRREHYSPKAIREASHYFTIRFNNQTT
jgi:hypothetical protein